MTWTWNRFKSGSGSPGPARWQGGRSRAYMTSRPLQAICRYRCGMASHLSTRTCEGHWQHKRVNSVNSNLTISFWQPSFQRTSTSTSQATQVAAEFTQSQRTRTWAIGLRVLVACGVVALLYHLNEAFTGFVDWPKEVRSDIRSGNTARRDGNLVKAAEHFSRAWVTLKSLPENKLSRYLRLKATSLAIALGDILEADGQDEEAYKVYDEAFDFLSLPSLKAQPFAVDTITEAAADAIDAWIGTSSQAIPGHDRESGPSVPGDDDQGEGSVSLHWRRELKKLLNDYFGHADGKERPQSPNYVLESSTLSANLFSSPISIWEQWRGIVLADRLATLAQRTGKSDSRVKAWYMTSIRLVLELWQHDTKLVSSSCQTSVQKAVDEAKLGLPTWASMDDSKLAGPLLSFARYLHKQGANMYQNAVIWSIVTQTVIFRRHEQAWTRRECCQMAGIYNIISDFYLHGLKDSDAALASSRDAIEMCELCGISPSKTSCRDTDIACFSEYVVALLRVGKIFETKDLLDDAKCYYEAAKLNAERTGMNDAIREASDSLLRLEAPAQDGEGDEKARDLCLEKYQAPYYHPHDRPPRE